MWSVWNDSCKKHVYLDSCRRLLQLALIYVVLCESCFHVGPSICIWGICWGHRCCQSRVCLVWLDHFSAAGLKLPAPSEPLNVDEGPENMYTILIFFFLSPHWSKLRCHPQAKLGEPDIQSTQCGSGLMHIWYIKQACNSNMQVHANYKIDQISFFEVNVLLIIIQTCKLLITIPL